MKNDAFLINTARGPIINENELIIALQKNKIAGAGLDVYEYEPLPEDHSLLKLNNVVLSPHIGYGTKELMGKFFEQIVENIEAYLNEKPIRIVR
jgi:D-3-phosphoglycerate dehydrogenase